MGTTRIWIVRLLAATVCAALVACATSPTGTYTGSSGAGGAGTVPMESSPGSGGHHDGH